MIVKGRNRDTAWFSIIDSEWPALRIAFEAWLQPPNFGKAGAKFQQQPRKTMKMASLPMSISDWYLVEAVELPGERGIAISRAQTFGDIRVRMVEYTPSYVADHWCSKGHVVLCLSGFLEIELRDGTRLVLKPGQSFHVGDGDPPHRSSAPRGAKLFIVD